MLIEIKKLVHDRRGGTLIEYVLLIGFVALLAVAGFRAFGGSINRKIQAQSQAVDGINGTLSQ